MENQTKIQTKPLEFFLKCNIATAEEKRKRLEGIKSIPNSELVIIENVLYLMDPPKSNYQIGKKRSSLDNPTLYEIGKRK